MKKLILASTPDWDPTSDTRIRNPMLYATELQEHYFKLTEIDCKDSKKIFIKKSKLKLIFNFF